VKRKKTEKLSTAIKKVDKLRTSHNNILICVSGLTPQIVTETFFCLTVKEKIPIHELYILTTTRGKEVILGKDKSPHTPNTSLKKELLNLCKLYNIPKPKFDETDKHIIIAKEETIELSDIRSDRDNILFPNRVAQFIRQSAIDPGNTLYCSITGGRKSMSVHLANALSLFAREHDKLLHVLTKEENEFKGFYPLTKKEAKDLLLSEIPFVRLRSLLSNELKGEKLIDLSFDKIVAHTQTQLKIISDKKQLICDLEKRELTFNYESLTLEPIEFLFYYHFIEKKFNGQNKISINELIAPETSHKFISYIEQYYPYYYIRETQKKNFQHGFDPEYFRTKRSKINKKIQELITDHDFVSQFIIEVDKIYGDSRYYIPVSKERIKLVLPR